MNINTLVLSGGGTKGIAFIGVLQYLKEYNLLKNIKTYVGTSIGSFVSTLCCLGYTLEEITDLVNKLDFKRIMDISLDTILDFHKTFGIDSGETFTKFIKILIKKKVEKDNITFLELYKKTSQHLMITGTCLNSCSTEYYDYINTPNMEIYKAVRISTCFPFYFKSFIHNGKHYTDGGVSNHYPISKFPKDTTLGILIDDSSYNNKDKIDDLFTFTNCIFQSSFKNIQTHILNQFKENTIFIDVDEEHSINFSMNLERKEKILKIGYHSATDFFKTYDIENINNKTRDIGVNTDNIETCHIGVNTQTNLCDASTSTTDLYNTYIENEIENEINKIIQEDFDINSRSV